MKKEKNQEKILLDQEGYDRLLHEIQDLKERENTNNKRRREAFDAGAGDGWDSPEFEEIEREDRLIKGALRQRYEELSRVEIIEKEINEETIQIGDIVTVIITGPNKVNSEKKIKLISGTPNIDPTLGCSEISINSPMGDAIYNKKINEESSYTVGDREFIVIVIEKENEQEREKEGTARVRKENK